MAGFWGGSGRLGFGERLPFRRMILQALFLPNLPGLAAGGETLRFFLRHGKTFTTSPPLDAAAFAGGNP
jgi:hypothetical protein